MSVVAGVGKAAGAEVLTGARPAGRAFPSTKRTLVVLAAALLALFAFVALIPASEAPNAEHSYSSAVVPTIGRGRQRRFPSQQRRLR